MSTSLAIDLGKFKSVACQYQSDTGERTFQTPPTLHDLIVQVQPARVVIEVGAAAGYILALMGLREVLSLCE